MRKVLLGVVLAAMVGWAVYEFVGKDDRTAVSDVTNATDGYEDEGAGEFITDEGSEMSNKAKGPGPAIGDQAPDFELQTLDGEQVKLSDFRGEPVMLNFWATWCPPCRAEMPDMEKFHNNEDITVLAVNLTEAEQSLEDVESFKDEFGLSFPILLDESVEVAGTYGIQPIPTSYMIDPEGIIRHKSIGPMLYSQMVDRAEEMK